MPVPFETYTHTGSTIHEKVLEVNASFLIFYPGAAGPFNPLNVRFIHKDGSRSDILPVLGTLMIHFDMDIKEVKIFNPAVGNDVKVAYSNHIIRMFAY